MRSINRSSNRYAGFFRSVRNHFLKKHPGHASAWQLNGWACVKDGETMHNTRGKKYGRRFLTAHAAETRRKSLETAAEDGYVDGGEGNDPSQVNAFYY